MTDAPLSQSTRTFNPLEESKRQLEQQFFSPMEQLFGNGAPRRQSRSSVFAEPSSIGGPDLTLVPKEPPLLKPLPVIFCVDLALELALIRSVLVL